MYQIVLISGHNQILQDYFSLTSSSELALISLKSHSQYKLL